MAELSVQGIPICAGTSPSPLSFTCAALFVQVSEAVAQRHHVEERKAGWYETANDMMPRPGRLLARLHRSMHHVSASDLALHKGGNNRSLLYSLF